jgi:MFS superfamily sulfate permease-like transporter
VTLPGVTFFLLGFFRLGSLLGFFPRHILVGCIGGVGVFLIITGLNVSTRLRDDDFSLSLETLLFFLRGHNLVLWVPAFALAALLRVITSRWHHQLILPTCAYPPIIILVEGSSLSLLFLTVDIRFFDYSGDVLYRRFLRRVRPGHAQERRVVIRGCEKRGEVVPILHLFRCFPSLSEDSFH